MIIYWKINNEHWKSVLFNLVMITLTGLFNAGKLPTVLKVFDTDYQLEYSENYSGTVHQETALEGYQYWTFLQRAFKSLVSENCTNFILTIRCIAVATHCNSNMGFKIFYSLEICMVEGSLKAHVFFSNYCPLIV